MDNKMKKEVQEGSIGLNINNPDMMVSGKQGSEKTELV